MKILQLVQGSPEWLAHRRTTRNASDASVMMNASPNISRRELVKLCATGVEREFSDYVQKRILDRGHEVEPRLRDLAEKMVGEDLYPVTGITEDGYLGASFDGVTMLGDKIFEAKQPSADKIELVEQNEIPPQDYWQIVQQFAVCETADECIYIVGDGTEANTRYMRIPRSRVEADIPKLRAAWAQFDDDVAAYVPEPVKAEVVASPVEGFGALSLRIEGRVLASNLDAFKAGADAFIAHLPKPEELQDDQDFADAEQAVKACEEAESKIKAAKEMAQAQMADVDAVFRAADTIAATIRTARLALDKAVKAEKENRRAEIVRAANDAYRAHVDSLSAETNGVWLNLQAPDLAGAIKGKRTLSSMRDAVDGVLAQAKIAANESAQHIRKALAVLSEETEGHKHLFPDHLAFIGKPVEDIRALIRGRIAEHQQREAVNLEAERERIRVEEEAKARAAAATNPEKETAPAAVVSANSTDEGAVQLHPVAAARPGARIKLGDINAAIAPLSITADGLAQMGFHPVGTERAAKLYDASQFEAITTAMQRVLAKAWINQKAAA